MKIEREEIPSWNKLFLLCLLIAGAHILSFFFETHEGLSEAVLNLRNGHALFAIFCLFFLFLKRPLWNSISLSVLMVLVYAPFYVLGWEVNVSGLANTDKAYVPFKNFWFHFLALSVVIPGSYILNLVLMLLFLIEIIVLWFYFDIENSPNAILEGEPFYTILFVSISLIMFIFNIKNNQIIENLQARKIRGGIFESLARAILSLRDRSNTPLQTLNIALFLVKKKCLEIPELSTMEDAIERLNKISEIMNQLGADFTPDHLELMSDEELISWFSKIKNERIKKELNEVLKKN